MIASKCCGSCKYWDFNDQLFTDRTLSLCNLRLNYHRASFFCGNSYYDKSMYDPRNPIESDYEKKWNRLIKLIESIKPFGNTEVEEKEKILSLIKNAENI